MCRNVKACWRGPPLQNYVLHTLYLYSRIFLRSYILLLSRLRLSLAHYVFALFRICMIFKALPKRTSFIELAYWGWVKSTSIKCPQISAVFRKIIRLPW